MVRGIFPPMFPLSGVTPMVMLCGNRNFTDEIKITIQLILREGDHPGLSEWLQYNHLNLKAKEEVSEWFKTFKGLHSPSMLGHMECMRRKMGSP